MLAELLDRIVGLGCDARAIKIHRHPLNSRTLFIEQRDGTYQREDCGPQPAAFELAGIDDVVRHASLFDAPLVFVSDYAVAMFDSGVDRHSRATCKLAHSARMSTLRKLKGGAAMTPRDAVRLLRHDLRGCVDPEVGRALSRVDFTRTSTGRSHVEHGKETLGRAVEAAVQQAEAIPETFVAKVPFWSTIGFDYEAAIGVAIHLDLEGQKVELQVLPDQIEIAEQKAVRWARDRLDELLPNATVHCGSPGEDG